jgi:hypothetical protein
LDLLREGSALGLGGGSNLRVMERIWAIVGQAQGVAEATTAKVKAAAYQAARETGRPVEYLGNGELSKENLARRNGFRFGVGVMVRVV